MELDQWINSIEESHSALARTVLGNEDSPNKTDALGRTPLHYALQIDNEILTPAIRNRAITRLIEKGANPNAQDKEGATPLHYCVIYNRRECIELLISLGANPNLQTFDLKLTPAHIALIENQRASIEALMLHGASADIVNAQGWSIRSHCPKSWQSILPVPCESASNAVSFFPTPASRLRKAQKVANNSTHS